MATFYFNGAVDNDWQTLGNWWMDDTFAIPATALPTSADDVIASASIATNSGSTPTVVNLTMNGNSVLSIVIGVTSLATFNDGSQCDLPSYDPSYTIANAVFNGTSNQINADIGTATFNDNSFNSTVVNVGIFNDSSANYGQVSNGGIFNDNASNASGGNSFGATFNDNSSNNGTVTGDATFNDNSYNSAGTVIGIAIFNHYSYNEGAVNTAIFNDNAYSAPAGNIVLIGTFNNNSINLSPSIAEFNFYDNSQNIAYINIGYFYDNAVNNIDGDVNSGYFYHLSSNQGLVYLDSYFYDSSYNTGIIVTYGEFNDSSFSYPISQPEASIIFQNRTPYPLKRGVNSSSLLAVV